MIKDSAWRCGAAVLSSEPCGVRIYGRAGPHFRKVSLERTNSGDERPTIFLPVERRVTPISASW
jgi:hypothetical protein